MTVYIGNNVPYSEEFFSEIEYDPVRMKCYYWKVAMLARKRAYRYKVEHKFRKAEFENRLADAILDNLDALVESTVKEKGGGICSE